MTTINSEPMADSVPRARLADLTRRDWLEAGQRLLKKGGIRALKLRALAAELGVSTGSFYHHFSDFDDYQGLLAAYFSGEQIDDILAEARQEPQPIGRIENLVRIVERDGLARLRLAMRAWAESDVRAEGSVVRQDSAVLAFLTANLLDLGFPETEARIRAYALLAVGLGSVYGTNGLARDTLRNGLLDLLCRS